MSGSSRWRWALGAAIALLGALVIASIVRTPEAAPSPAPPCPHGFMDQPARGDLIVATLRSTSEGAALLAELHQEVRWCFGEMPNPVVTEERVLLMDPRPPLEEQAARAGHLLDHVSRGMPYPDRVEADTACDGLVDRALRREAAAYALEVRLRRALGVGPSRYEFEPELSPLDSRPEQEALVERYLREHPDGAPNIDPLARGYRQRCEVERAELRSAR